jgi:hypothetical protein
MDSSSIWYRGFSITVLNTGYYKYQYLVGEDGEYVNDWGLETRECAEREAMESIDGILASDMPLEEFLHTHIWSSDVKGKMAWRPRPR